jgi:hypothetical protein
MLLVLEERQLYTQLLLVLINILQYPRKRTKNMNLYSFIQHKMGRINFGRSYFLFPAVFARTFLEPAWGQTIYHYAIFDIPKQLYPWRLPC